MLRPADQRLHKSHRVLKSERDPANVYTCYQQTILTFYSDHMYVLEHSDTIVQTNSKIGGGVGGRGASRGVMPG